MVTSSSIDLGGQPTTTTTTSTTTAKLAPLEIEITDALPSDAPAIAALGAQCFSDTFGHSVPAADLASFLASTYSASAMLECIQDATGRISTFLVRGAEAEAELRRLYVEGSAQGRGVGGALVRALERRARDEGVGALRLSVWEGNARARRVYAARGYVRVGETDFVMGGCVQTDWVMAKKLV
ncbi:acyl-CoA N-acyltransferase [Biscogniauxia mediterranea]|nr:acyl-CoA N-acyltransferase [Biscogniauxia mediterranea]